MFLKTSLICFKYNLILHFNQYSFISIILSSINKLFLSVSKREFKYKEQRLNVLYASNVHTHTHTPQ